MPRFLRCGLLLVAAVAVAVPSRAIERTAAPAGSAVGERIENAIRRGGLRGARLGIIVSDLGSGEILYEKNADELLIPASLTKIVTSAAVLHELKPQYRFRTAVYGTGKLVGGTWKGDLYLKAWGDPAIGDERLWTLASELRRRGIRTVSGAVRVDDTFFDRRRFGEDWGTLSRAWYCAPHGAVSVNGNTVEVRGRYIAIDGDPSLHAGRFFAEMLKREGIDVEGAIEAGSAVPDAAVLLASSDSKPLAGIVADLNKVSNNFIAEQLLKTLGAEVSGPPGTASKGILAVNRYLSGLGIREDGYRLFDGSGLSHSNRLSARTLHRVLSAVVRDFAVGPEFLASLKVAGIDGHATRFQDSLCKRRMRVKTGHLFGVAGLAGFAETVGGRRLAFSIVANDYRRGRRGADRGIEDVCEAFLTLGGDSERLALDVLATPAHEVAEALPPAPEAPAEEEDPGGLEEGD